MLQCEFCSKEYSNKIGFSNHVRRCPSNPNRVHESDRFGPETRKKLSEASKRNNELRWNDPLFREKHKAAMRRAVEENPESYSSSNRGRTKQTTIDGVKLQGQWEVDFYLWAKQQGLNPVRPKQAFVYEWNGSRLYHPDFYIESMDLYVEVKGYETERDTAKWRDFPLRLVVVRKEDIMAIRNGTWKGL